MDFGRMLEVCNPHGVKKHWSALLFTDFLFWSSMGGGSSRIVSRRKSPNASDFARSFAPAAVVLRVLFASTASVSHRVFIMVDILMLMFFAIVGLVFLSYIIYLLWWSCVATRAAGAQGQHGMCVHRALHPSVLSWKMVWRFFFFFFLHIRNIIVRQCYKIPRALWCD